MAAMARPGLGIELAKVFSPEAASTPHPLAQTPPKESGGFFREGGMGRYIAGAIGDVLLQQAGMRPAFMPAMEQRRQAEMSEAQWHKRRMAEREDKQWEWANRPKDAGNPHYWETNDGSLAMIDPVTGMPKVLYKDPTPKTSYITADNGDGTKTIIPVVNGVPQMGGTPQASPRLGPVVDSIPGGPTPPASGTFRP